MASPKSTLNSVWAASSALMFAPLRRREDLNTDTYQKAINHTTTEIMAAD